MAKYNVNWQARINNANRLYEKWEMLFKCKTLEKYYEGFQWQNLSGAPSDYLPYTLNLIYSTIKIKLGNLVPQRPSFEISPVPNKMDWNLELAVRGAQIKQDTLNTVVRNPRAHFKGNLKLAALDSMFRFGIIKTDYAADWSNPLSVPFTGNNKEEASDDIPFNERVYFEHIRASRFRVSSADSPFLDNCAWCGYHKFHLAETLGYAKDVNLPKDLKIKYNSSDYEDISRQYGVDKNSSDMFNLLGSGKVLKTYYIWDNFEKKHCMYIDGHWDDPIYEKKFEILPFSDALHDLRAPSNEDSDFTGWYPIPPVFQWISPQDEVNRSREQLRNYRRRFTRKFAYVKGAIEPTELEKFKNEIDGEVIEVKSADAIGKVDNPDVGIAIQESLISSENDLNLITGTSPQARAQSDRQTATATKLLNAHEQVRENVESLEFDDFIVNCARKALVIMKERFTEGIWVKMSADPSSSMEELFGEVQAAAPVFKYVQSQDIDDGYDEDIMIAVVEGTPAKMLEEETKFIKFITYVTSNPAIAFSPTLIREVAYKVGYRNERGIREFQKMALVALIGQVQGAAAQAGGGAQGINANNESRQLNNAKPNASADITNQLAMQMGG